MCHDRAHSKSYIRLARTYFKNVRRKITVNNIGIRPTGLRNVGNPKGGMYSWRIGTD